MNKVVALQFLKGYPQNNTGINHGQGQVCYQSHSVIEKLEKYQIYDRLNILSPKQNNRNPHPKVHLTNPVAAPLTYTSPGTASKTRAVGIWVDCCWGGGGKAAVHTSTQANSVCGVRENSSSYY